MGFLHPGVSVRLRLSTFARVCLLPPSALVNDCLYLFAFVCVCSRLLTTPFVPPPSAWLPKR